MAYNAVLSTITQKDNCIQKVFNCIPKDNYILLSKRIYNDDNNFCLHEFDLLHVNIFQIVYKDKFAFKVFAWKIKLLIQDDSFESLQPVSVHS